MRRGALGVALAAGAAAGWAWWAGDGETVAIPRSAASEVLPTVAAPPDDPDALAAWFERQVVGALERPARAPAVGRPAATAAASRAPRTRLDRAAVEALVASGEIERHGPIDWEYLDDVFDGRVGGIPNERRAGIGLVDMLRIGDVPYVEALREANDVAALRELGLGEEAAAPATEAAPWPICLRLGTCRTDPSNTP